MEREGGGVGSEECKQYAWLARVTHRTIGVELADDRGIIDAPMLMTAFDAADYAVRIGVRDVLKGGDVLHHGQTVTAAVYGRSEASPGVRVHQCTAVGEYDADMDVFKRLEPWRGEGAWREVGSVDGVRFVLADWNPNG